jgi:hypothetical protein
MSLVQSIKSWFKPRKVVLNLGISGPTYGVSTMTSIDRWCVYLDELEYLVELDELRYRRDSYGESVLVATGTLRRGVTKWALWKLAVVANQDCIAVYYPDTDTGALLGPFANKWGRFDKACFVF